MRRRRSRYSLLHRSICETPGNTTFTVNAGATTSPTYQWQESTDGGSTYLNLADAGIYSGTSTTTLTLTTATLAEDGYLYRVIVSGTCSPNVTSDGALLTVEEDANITVQPVAATECEGGVATYTVTASGTDLQYSWEEDQGGGFAAIADGGIYSGSSSNNVDFNGDNLGDGHLGLPGSSIEWWRERMYRWGDECVGEPDGE